MGKSKPTDLPPGWRRLVLTRREGQGLRIDGVARIVYVGFREGAVRLAIEAPDSTRIFRDELLEGAA